MKSIVGLMLICWLAGVGCVSYKEHAAKRTARLREIYPPGMSKEEVQSRWQGIKPDFSATRPEKGWEAHPNQFIAKKIVSEEASTGKSIASVDRYWGPDGLWSLCYCWYYYDAAGKIVDVEWQYKSD